MYISEFQLHTLQVSETKYHMKVSNSFVHQFHKSQTSFSYNIKILGLFIQVIRIILCVTELPLHYTVIYFSRTIKAKRD